MDKNIKRKTFRACLVGASTLFFISTNSPIKKVNGENELKIQEEYESSLVDIKYNSVLERINANKKLDNDSDIEPSETPDTDLDNDSDIEPSATPNTDLDNDSDIEPSETPDTNLDNDSDIEPSETPDTNLDNDSNTEPSQTPDTNLDNNDNFNEKVLAGISTSSYDIKTLERVKEQLAYEHGDVLYERKEAEELPGERERVRRIELINYYSNVYNLDEKDVLRIIKKETNLLKDKSVIKKVNKKEIELRILKKVKSLTSRAKEEYDYEKNRKIREMVYYYADLYGIDKYLAIAIECHETGYYTSPVCIKKNNVGGQRYRVGKNKYKYYKYDNIEQGIISHMETLLHYKGQSITTMGKRYCPGSKTWPENVKSLYDDFKSNPKVHRLKDE